MDDFDEFEISYQRPFVIKEPNKIDEEIKKQISSVKEICYLSNGDCELLLRYFNWNINRMNDVYYDDPDIYLKKAGTKFVDTLPSPELNCEICFCDTKHAIGLNCGHYFCKECWIDYVTTKHEDGVNLLQLKCMQKNCEMKLHYEFVKQLSTFLSDRYWYFLKKEYVECQGNVFCPNPSCGRAIIIVSSERKQDTIVCTCGQQFCFKCLGEFHSPATCEEVNEWLLELTKDDENSYEMLKAKKCYHCGLLCERTHGCNHMTCPKCKGEWCWMCRGDWKTHGEQTGGYYSCNNYNAGKTKGNEIDNEIERKKKKYERMKHFFGRWLDHNVLLRQSRERKETNMKVVFELFKNQNRIINRIEEAFDVLILARSWLKFSYCHAYFMNDDENTNTLFSHQQAQIEHWTENFGELLFKDVKQYDIEQISKLASTIQTIIKNFS